jgi:hypothetical protein
MDSNPFSEDLLPSTSLPVTAQLAMAQDDNKSSLSSLDSATIHTPPPNGTSLATTSTPAYVPNGNGSSSAPFGLSTATTAILARMSAQPASDYSVAREHILNSITTSDRLPALPITKSGRGRGRPKGSGKKGIASAATATDGASVNPTTPSNSITGTPKTASSRGRGGKMRGGGRGRGGKRAGKRKRADSEVSSLSESEADGVKKENDGNDESDDAINLPKVTKSGRAVHRPSQFVPVLPSPTATSGMKRKRTKRNLENAVCKSCERGHSPNNNAIVFCDGCGTPYHQYCHTPPIEKEFIEIQEKEWLCSKCSKTTEDLPLDLQNLVSGENKSEEEVRYL